MSNIVQATIEINVMNKRHYFDNQDDMDATTYRWLESRYANIAEVDSGKLQRKWRDRGDFYEDRESTRKAKRSRERLN